MTDVKKLLLSAILLLAFALRFYGVNWDQNQHLHPDERFLTMVTEAIDWPANIPEYFDTAHSPLNPHNRGFGFFVYQNDCRQFKESKLPGYHAYRAPTVCSL